MTNFKIEWGELPPEPPDAHRDLVNALRERPGEWAQVMIQSSDSEHTWVHPIPSVLKKWGAVTQIRNGRVWAMVPERELHS